MVLVLAREVNTWELDAADTAASFPEVVAVVNPPTDTEAALENLRMFAAEVARHDAARRLDRESAFGDHLLREWDSILTAREDLERERESPLTFTAVDAQNPSQVTFISADPIDEAKIVGQVRTVAGRSRYSGRVVAVDENEIVL